MLNRLLSLALPARGRERTLQGGTLPCVWRGITPPGFPGRQAFLCRLKTVTTQDRMRSRFMATTVYKSLNLLRIGYDLAACRTLADHIGAVADFGSVRQPKPRLACECLHNQA